MQRDLKRMAKSEFDVVFVGGGVTGAAAAYDAALRGLRVALLEKKDFGWATSAATSKLIHGGLRYLKNFEFGLVRESLRERRTLELIAPHMVRPAPFLVPTYKHSSNNLPMISAGMVLYDLLSYDKARLADEERQLPHFSLFSRARVLTEEPGVDPTDLTGGALYYDCQMHHPERLTLEFVLGAAARGAQVANYAEVSGLLRDGNRIAGVTVRDVLTGEQVELRSQVTANVAGPWADFVSGFALGKEAQKHLIRSQGIHLIFRKVIEKYAIVLRTKGGRHFFLIPWRGKTLAGTTDEVYRGSPDDYQVTCGAAQRFVNEINEVYPSAKLSLADVTWAYGGLRPIVEDETDVEVEVYDASRKYEIYDHAETDKIQGFLTVIGGKYTTSRQLAETLVNRVVTKLGLPKIACATAQTPLPGAGFGTWREFLNQGRAAHPHLPARVLEELSWDYGIRREEVVRLMQDAQLAKLVDERHPIPAAAVAFAAEEEMAMTLDDVLFRRTGLGTTGELSEEAVRYAALIAGSRLGWDKAQTDHEIATALDKLVRRNMIEE